MALRDKPLFLARETYRRRRVIDAARLLPVFGTVLFLVPILWDLAGPQSTDAQAPPGLAQRGMYLFAVWGGLVLAAGILAARLLPVAGPEGENPVPPGAAAAQTPDAGHRDVANPAPSDVNPDLSDGRV